MSRLGAGIGTRGPGETKLETDQRHIRRRIYDIKRRLSSVAQQREQYRKRRKANEVFQIAVVGYTNAGKSTLFNRLTDSESMVEDKLFATLDPLTRQIKLPSGFQSLLTDTVGFIQDLPTSLIAAFKSTLEEVSEADFLLHVVDGSNPDLEQHQHTVRILLEELHADTIPMLTIYNKKDLMEKDFIPSNHPYFIMSAYEDGDVDLLQTKIEESLIKEWKYYKLELRPDEGKIMTRLELETIVKDKYFNEEKNYYIVKGYMQKNHALESLLEE